MTEREIIKRISQESGLTIAAVAKVRRIEDRITIEAVRRGDRVRRSGFYTIKPAMRKARKNNNPRGGTVDLPARVTMKFKLSKAVRQHLNKDDLALNALDRLQRAEHQ